MGTLYHSNWSLESSRINRAPPFFIIYVNWRIWIHYEEFLQKIYTIICNNESKTQWSWGCSVFDAIIDHVTGVFSCHNTTLIIPQGYMEKGHRKYSIPLGVKKFSYTCLLHCRSSVTSTGHVERPMPILISLSLVTSKSTTFGSCTMNTSP